MSAHAVPGPAGVAVPDRRRSRQERLVLAFVALGIVAIVVCSALRIQANPILALFVGVLVLLAWHRALLAWPALLGYVLACVLFIPMRRFTLGGGLPVGLEPYRVLILVVLLVWIFALLADPRTRWQKTRIDAPVIGFVVAVILSVALNLRSILAQGITSEVLKQVSLFAGFFLVMYFAASVLRDRRSLDRTLMFLVGGGALVAVSAIVESRTNLNVFNHIDRFIPVLHGDPGGAVGPPDRGGRARAFASAEHPIALGAMLVLLMPIGIYLYRRRTQNLWLGAVLVLMLGALSTGSRTASLMLLAQGVAFLVMKRDEAVRMIPRLIPLLIVCQVLMPGTIGTFKAIVFPGKSGLIAEQQGGYGSGTGRVADLGPSLREWSKSPFVGQGFGTRLTSESDPFINARILDNEWLGVLLEVGAIGFLTLIWLYARAVRTLGRRAKRDPSTYGWLLACLATAIAAFPVGMLTYDAFSFTQVTFVSFILVGLGLVAIRLGPEPEEVTAAAVAEREAARELDDRRGITPDMGFARA